MPVLTAIDVLGIQAYVFGSNKLRDVLAASWRVSDVTSRERLTRWPGIESVLLDTGGSAIVELGSLEAAREWTSAYTRWLLEAAPGLEVAVCHQPYEQRPLAWALRALQIELARAKLERRPSVPQLGLSVTARCALTGLPATSIDQGELVSQRIRRLRDQLGNARARWNDFLPALANAPGREPAFPDELDLMGRTHGETSLVGFVHVDGNSVGETIRAWLERCIDAELDDGDVRKQYGEWSSAILELGRSVLERVARRTADGIREEDDGCFLRGTPHDLDFRLHDGTDGKRSRARGDTVFLPLRPILLGGDDLTFACDGRIALDLAAAALRELESHPIPYLGRDGGETRLTACAGVALVKAHAPFHRSYELAEDLCRSAKLARRRQNDKTATDTGSWLDWHVGSTRPGEAVEDIRARQYQRGPGRSLTLRPYPLAGFEERKESWQWLERQVLGPRCEDGEDDTFRGFAWCGSRSRVQRLGALAAEAREVESQVAAWRVVERRLRLPGGLGDDGRAGDGTPLRDAIELMDLHLRLEPDPRTPEPTTNLPAAAAAGDRKDAP